MSTDTGRDTGLSPDTAFAVLGNEARMGLLQTLGEADRPLSFSELHDRSDLRDSGQFNYHLDKLTGHFVQRTADGYRLGDPGRRVIEAILSGAITDSPVLEPTEIDFECLHCGAPVVVSYDRGAMQMSCSECDGHFSTTTDQTERDDPNRGNLANYAMPPAGIQNRSAEAVMRAAATWGHLSTLALADGLCPRCSAAIEQSVEVCEKHDPGPGKCLACDSRFAIRILSDCTNCIFSARSSAFILAPTVPAVLAFLGDHGLNTTSRGIEWGWDFDEEILSTDPFAGRITFTIDGDSISLTINDTLNVIETTRAEPTQGN